MARGGRVCLLAARDSASCKKWQHVHLLVWPGSIFPSRPYSLVGHGAQGRVKAGRRAAPRRNLDVSRPRLDRPSTVPPWGDAVPIPA